MTTIYEFSAKSLAGKPVSFEDFRGKVLLIVNTASDFAENSKMVVMAIGLLG